MPSSPLSHNLTRSFGVLLALLLFLVGFSMRNFRALSHANDLNIHTYQVINGTLLLEGTLLAIESGTRGFLVTGEKSALASYRFQLRVYNERFRALNDLVSDNPTQVANLKELDARKQKWIGGLLEPLLARRRALTDPDQQSTFATRSASPRRRVIAELQKVTDRITMVEEQLLIRRTQAQQRAKWWTQFTLLTGSAFSILLTGFLVLFASKGARRLDKSNALLGEAKTRAEIVNAQLLQTNAQLESEIGARRAADEKLRRSVLDLQRSNAELEQFAYVASHDLQEPLRAVGGCVQVLQRRYEGKLDARADQFIQHAVDGAQRMQNLINDLLAYSRLGNRIPALEPAPGDKIVRSALKNVSVAVAESGAQIDVDQLPTLICDAGQIEQVLQNLISNAIKFRSENAPRIHIGYSERAENGARFHVVSVEDDGLGIEPQYFERIFVMFQRLHTRAQYAGTGIGLSICKKIIERHGGRIWVESWPRDVNSPNAKHGSKFSFSLPFLPEILVAETELEAEKESASLSLP